MTTLKTILDNAGYKFPSQLTVPTSRLLDTELNELISPDKYANLVYFAFLLIDNKISFSRQQAGYECRDPDCSAAISDSMFKRASRINNLLSKQDSRAMQKVSKSVTDDFSIFQDYSAVQLGLLCQRISRPLAKLVKHAFQLPDVRPAKLKIDNQNPFIIGHQLGPNPDNEQCLDFDWTTLAFEDFTTIEAILELYQQRMKLIAKLDKFNYDNHGLMPTQDQLDADRRLLQHCRQRKIVYQPKMWRSNTSTLINASTRPALNRLPPEWTDSLVSLESSYQLLRDKITNPTFKRTFPQLSMVANFSIIPVPDLNLILAGILNYGIGGRHADQQTPYALKMLFSAAECNDKLYSSLVVQLLDTSDLVNLDSTDELKASLATLERILKILNTRSARYIASKDTAMPIDPYSVKWVKLQTALWSRVKDIVIAELDIQESNSNDNTPGPS